MIASRTHFNIGLEEVVTLLKPLNYVYEQGFPVPGSGLMYLEVMEIVGLVTEPQRPEVQEIVQRALAWAFGGNLGEYKKSTSLRFILKVLSHRTSVPPRKVLSKIQAEKLELFLLFLKSGAEEALAKG